MDIKKLKKGLTCAAVAVIAISGSITYISKGNVEIKSVARDTVIEETEIEETAVKAVADSAEAEPDETDSAVSSDKVDINSAGLDELQIAPGIGPSKAQAIIDYRNEYGSFSCVDELIEVSGIGEKTLAKIKDYYCVK